ncbi:MAG: Rho termination factor N-terminal domain-containing protein [Clostridium sp.]|uniref:Rho termination factor N-terminal domain-containing protein n=1 Tax=Clostridium sp. TaxID=1506 RepID=UPI003217FBA3
MEYRLKKDNIEKVVVDEDYKKRLVKDGWEDIATELSILNIEQLKELAIEKGIEIPSKAKKDEIITMIEDAK